MIFQWENFSFITESSNEIHAEEHASESKPLSSDIKQEIDVTPKTDSGQGDDETSSTSSQSWQIEDVDEEDYDARFMKLSESMKSLEKQFENDFRPFVKTDPVN